MELTLKRVLHECMFTWGNYIKWPKKIAEIADLLVVEGLVQFFFPPHPQRLPCLICRQPASSHPSLYLSFSLSPLYLSLLYLKSSYLQSPLSHGLSFEYVHYFTFLTCALKMKPMFKKKKKRKKKRQCEWSRIPLFTHSDLFFIS